MTIKDIITPALKVSSTPASSTTVPVVYAGVNKSKKMLSKEAGIVKQVVAGVGVDEEQYDDTAQV